MASRNERPNRARRATGQDTNRSAVRRSRGSRNEMGRYSRYSSEGRSYPGDSRSTMRRTAGVRPAGQAAAGGAGSYSRDSSAYSHSAAKRKSGRGKKIAIGIVAAVIVALVGCGTALAVYINGINEKINTGNKTKEQIDAIDEQLVSADLNKPFYMMLIGSDIRPGQDQSESRSDTNILVRVDGSNNQVTLVSIPRDTAIDIDGHGVSKFNNAYTYDGVAGVIREASELCGIDIAHYAEVNFDNLVALVDAVGGVDVEVSELIDDPDADGSWDPNVEPIIIEPGMQHLDGEAALVFARSRAYADGDFTRTENQRKLIQAIVDKVLSMPVTELPGVIEAAASCVTTDLSVTDIISLAQQFQDGGDLTMYSAMVPSVAQYVNGVSYVFADTGQLAKMMQVVEEGGDPSGITVSDEMLAQAIASEQSGGTSSYGSGYGSGYSSDYGVYSSGYGSGYGSGYVTSGGASGTFDGGYAAGGDAYGSGAASGGGAYGSGYASGY